MKKQNNMVWYAQAFKGNKFVHKKPSVDSKIIIKAFKQYFDKLVLNIFYLLSV